MSAKRSKVTRVGGSGRGERRGTGELRAYRPAMRTTVLPTPLGELTAVADASGALTRLAFDAAPPPEAPPRR